jgi:fermentation-respiration switch protein FrsA (DUF1100 family)
MSEGRPNQRGLQLDAQAALDHLLARDDVSSSSIVVFGRSLGGAVAIHLAAENQDKVRWWDRSDHLDFGAFSDCGESPALHKPQVS